jgi:hypothetical protein
MTRTLPSINHPTNLPNFTEVTVGDLTVWFSYRTPVAFHTPEGGRHVCENVWSKTTGKHLAYLDGGGREGRARRTPREAFLIAWEAAVAGDTAPIDQLVSREA